MLESAALLVDEVLPRLPMRQLTPGMACSRAMQEQLPRVLSFPFQLRFLFASRPAIMSRVMNDLLGHSITHSKRGTCQGEASASCCIVP